MNKTSPPLPVEYSSFASCRSVSRGISYFVIGVGCLVLAGWTLDIAALKSIVPGLASMKSNTALLFILSSISLWMQVKGQTHRIAQICAFSVAFVALLTLGEYLIDRDFGIDQLLFKDTAVGVLHPGRMAPATTLCFLLIGPALIFLDDRSRNRFRETLVLATFAISTLALIGYLYGVSSLYQIGAYTSMALHTALSFILLSMAILFARPEQGLMKTILADTAGGNILRRILPTAIVLPIALGWLRLWGQRAGLYDTAFGLALMVSSLITTLTIVIWFNARQLTIVDMKRSEVNATLLEREKKLAKLFEILPVGISILDDEHKISYTNPALKKILGISEEGLLKGAYLNRKYLRVDGTLMPVDELASVRVFKEKREIDGVEIGVVKEDNHIVWTEVSAVPVDFPDWKVVLVTSDITERRHAEERFRLAIEAAPNAVIMVDQQGQIVLVNSQAEKYFGYDRVELMTKSIDNLVPVRFLRNHADHRSRFFSQPQARAMGVGRDLYGLRKDGVEFPVEIGLAPINTQEGLLVLATIVDITERKKIEAEARKLEERFSVAFRASPAGLTITTVADGRFVDVNESYLAMLGYDREEVIGRTAVELNMLSAEERAKPIQQLREQGHIRNIELQLQAKSGRLFNVLFSSEQIELNGMACALTIVVDITERRQADQALKQQHRLLRTLVDILPVEIYVKDRERRFLLANKLVASAFGEESTDEVIGKRDEDFMPPEAAKVFAGEDEEIMRTARSLVNDEHTPPHRADSHQWFLRTKIPLQDEAGNIIGLIGMGNDITKIKRVEDELIKLNRGLEEKIVQRTAQLAESNEQLRQLAIVDELTGLYNRRGFLLLAEEQLLLAKRTHRNMLVFYADLDGLKQINDRFGHVAGDEAIVKAAHALNETFRTSDVKARLGGDEFIVFAVEAEEHSGQSLLARLRDRLAENNQSMSVGVIAFDAQNDTSIDNLIARADDAMYAEKRTKPGRL